MHPQGAAQVAAALGRAHAHLGRRLAAPLQQVGHHLEPGLAAEGMGQQRRLVVAAVKQPRPMQRHRHDQVGPGGQGPAGAGQPFPESRRRVGAVCVLEGEDHAAAEIAIGHDGAGALIGRAVADAGAAQNAVGAVGMGVGVEFERQSANRTLRRAQEVHPPPARPAQSPCLLDDGVADRTPGRQQDV